MAFSGSLAVTCFRIKPFFFEFAKDEKQVGWNTSRRMSGGLPEQPLNSLL